jgi:single-stranded-DNA-specific exonuclease
MSAAAEKVWQPVVADEAAARALADDSSQPLPVARLLWARGCRDAESVDHYLNPRLSALGDPFVLPGLRVAVERIWRAIDAGERIAVFGDYDVDGITSTALLVQVLRQLGAQATPFLPHRLEEGYGLGPEALHRCLETCTPSLIVTVDCGTGSVDAVREAAQRGVDVIVTDHHHPGEALAPAVALVNPKLGADEAIQMLAGVGVTFKLCHGLAKYGRELGRATAALDLRPHLDLVALGTIADIVPLVGENRILARHGLNQLNQTANPGLQALIEVAAIEDRIDAYEVGFRLGPRLNAAGRLGDAQRALDVLLGGEGVDVVALAEELDRSNRERQEIEAGTVKEALEELEARFDPARDFGLVVGRMGWHPGVVGIVASRLLQRFHRPVAVVALTDEGGRGSCRSIEGFDMMAGLNACAEELAKFGGHTMAAGLELKPGRLDAFAARFNEAARQLLAGRDLRPVQRIDAWMGLDEVDDALADALDRMRPFGVGNATPVWGARGVRVVGAPRVVGKGHLKLLLAAGSRQIEAMGWGMGERALPEGPLDVAFQIKRDRFRGQERLVLHLQDLRPAERET